MFNTYSLVSAYFYPLLIATQQNNVPHHIFGILTVIHKYPPTLAIPI
jgi:hypothetical protein